MADKSINQNIIVTRPHPATSNMLRSDLVVTFELGVGNLKKKSSDLRIIIL